MTKMGATTPTIVTSWIGVGPGQAALIDPPMPLAAWGTHT